MGQGQSTTRAGARVKGVRKEHRRRRGRDDTIAAHRRMRLVIGARCRFTPSPTASILQQLTSLESSIRPRRRTAASKGRGWTLVPWSRDLTGPVGTQALQAMQRTIGIDGSTGLSVPLLNRHARHARRLWFGRISNRSLVRGVRFLTPPFLLSLLSSLLCPLPFVQPLCSVPSSSCSKYQYQGRVPHPLRPPSTFLQLV